MDVEDRALMQARSWRWMQIRIVQLLSVPKTRISRALRAPAEEHEPVDDE